MLGDEATEEVVSNNAAKGREHTKDLPGSDDLAAARSPTGNATSEETKATEDPSGDVTAKVRIN